MRNLKKFLALVLAMVMAFSLMLSASATDISKFEDQDKVTDEFVEAVAVLTGLDVIKGDGDEENPSIRPQDEITRAEAAALVYRIATGDINDAQVKLYSDYGKFSDVKSDDWFAGYVGYCQNAGIIKGNTPTTFNPYGKVTGYEVLAMILRAAGYGKNNEFTGSTWQVNVASLAKTKHISDSVTSTLYNYTLNMNARREIVAELLFRGSLIPQVTWSSALGYNEYNSVITTPNPTNYNDSLAREVFGLEFDGWAYSAWGVPQFSWSADKNPSKDRTVATLTAKASFDFHEGDKRECDVAEMLEITDEDTYVLWVNASRVTDTYRIKATDTVTRVGGWGRKVAIYLQEDMDAQYPWHNTVNYYNNVDDGLTRALPDTFVMIDTYLAKVISTTNAVLDPAGHVITPARMVVDLYDRDQNQVLRRTISKAAGSKENWEYSAGQTISLEGKANSLNTTIPAGQTDPEAWAFSLPTVRGNTQTLVEGTDVRAITLREGVQAKQTSVYWNNGKHQVGGEDKTDDLALRMDKAGNNIDTTFTWIYDDYGYLLGIDNGGKVNYGVITSVYVSYGAETSTDGVAQAVATVKYADGTTDTETVDYFMVNDDSSNTTIGDRAVGGQMTATLNTLELRPYYGVSSTNPMQENYGTLYDGSANAINSAVCAQRAQLFMAPVAATNSAAAKNVTIASPVNQYGVLNNNLFKFVKSAGDKTVAIEVAGGMNVDNSSPADGVMDTTDYTLASGNTGAFAGHWNVTNTGGKVYKTLSYITNATGTVVTWIDNDTQIMVRNADNGSIACYNGVSALPGDVIISTTTSSNYRYDEIDWADTDNDGRADVVYLTGTIEGVTAYGLFYSNALVAQWDGTTAQIDGFLNGEKTTLTFNSYDEFNKINSQIGYAGHLFAVKQIGGVVTDVLMTHRASETPNKTVKLLPKSGDILTTFGSDAAAAEASAPTATGISVDGLGTGTSTTGDFKYGNETGYLGSNPYTATTEAVYWSDNSATPVRYNNSANWTLYGATVTVSDASDVNSDSTYSYTYRLTPNSKVYGLGNGVVLAEGATALEYLEHSYTNDVTIVYENNDTGDGYSVLEMYIQTDPNITPNNPNYGAYTPSGTAVKSFTNVYTTTSDPSGTNLGNAIKALGNNNVAYCANVAADTGTMLVPHTDAPEQLYFPFRLSTSGTIAYLSIYNASGSLVFAENTGSAIPDTYGHYFMINFRNAVKNSNPNVTLNNALTAGNYTFTIVAGGTTISSGSFTIV